MNGNRIKNQKTIGNRLGTKLAIGLLIVAMFAATALPAAALQDLKVTDENMNYLYMFTYGYYRGGAFFSYSAGAGVNPYLLRYSYGDLFNRYGVGRTAVTVGTETAIKIGDGECVAFAKAMSNTNNIASTNWRRGNHVLDGGVISGTVIATFSGPNTYSGHVAIFDKYYYVQGLPYGIYVWDQNYVSPYLVGKHVLLQSSSGVNNANNYYIVQE